MPEPVTAILIIVVPSVLLVALIVMEVLFRRGEVGDRWKRLVGNERSLLETIRQLRRQVDEARRRMRDAAGSYEEGYLHRLLRRRPIRDLKPYLSVSMSWSALEDAGITNLERFMAFRGNFERLHGIGESRGRGLRSARRQLRQELAETTLPMPTVRGPGTLEFEVVVTALRTAKMRERITPGIPELKQQLEQVRQRRPGALGVRWQYWFGDREELLQSLEQCNQQIEPVVEDEAARLEQFAEAVGSRAGDVEQLAAVYEECEETVRELIDEATRRPVRGALRPVGAAAMRAAEGFDDEEDFCDRVLEPLVAKLGYDHRREHTIKRRIGSRDKTMYVDFLLMENGEPVAVLEAKRKIRTDNQLEGARQQGLSYALFEQVEPVMVAAPDGLWVYERDGQQLEFHAELDIEEAFDNAHRLRELIERIGGKTRRQAQPESFG